jgi:hypothetical protein
MSRGLLDYCFVALLIFQSSTAKRASQEGRRELTTGRVVGFRSLRTYFQNYVGVFGQQTKLEPATT